MSAQIIGPFELYDLVVDGYRVPGVEAQENDGGTVTFIVDRRMAWTIPAGSFEDVAALVANVYAIGAGLTCAPSDAYGEPAGADLLPALARFSRVHEIASVESSEAEQDDDPRIEGTEQ
jgi:hypothetical protein